ncbi:MAG: hypothetical protein CVT89_05430 [Candidatus Altiarchaeales archaeon HGW-Altiarchaeales-2]|nr:MAG: hypothetical protein CVT89_05430 [Candidatus Altiarchaeales archaeon HGW-Altiarchaeales-2]
MFFRQRFLLIRAKKGCCDIMNRKVRKAMEYVNNKYRYVVVVGKKEVEENKVTLRDMESGEQKFLGIEEIDI